MFTKPQVSSCAALPLNTFAVGNLEQQSIVLSVMDSWRCSLLVITLSLVTLQLVVLEVEAAPGVWRVVTKNAGVAAMHAAVTPGVGSVVLLDHTNTGPSNITFPGWYLDLDSTFNFQSCRASASSDQYGTRNKIK